MPLLYQHNINEQTRLAVWHITEDEIFFLEKVPSYRGITNHKKRLQHLAGRFLLQYLFPDFPSDLIQIADTRKPYVPGEKYHFSISHCGDYAAAIVSLEKRVGIDIELFTSKVLKLKHKFLSDNELNFAGDNIEMLILLWSAKEALFKWYGHGKMDFRQHLHLEPFDIKDTGIFRGSILKVQDYLLKIEYKFFDKFVLAWIIEE